MKENDTLRCKFSNLKRIDCRNLAALPISRLGDLSEEFGLGALEGQVSHISESGHLKLIQERQGFLSQRLE